MMYCQETFSLHASKSEVIEKPSRQVIFSHLSMTAPSPSVLRAVLCSMKKEFAVNPDLTSMPLAHLGRIPQEWMAVGMWIEKATLEQMNLVLILCLVLSFLYYLLLCLLCSR